MSHLASSSHSHAALNQLVCVVVNGSQMDMPVATFASEMKSVFERRTSKMCNKLFSNDWCWLPPKCVREADLGGPLGLLGSDG